MSLLGPIGGLSASLLERLPGLNRAETPAAPIRLPDGLRPAETPAGGNFGSVFEKLISEVDAKQDTSQAATRRLLLGESDQLHQGVIAMQEAGVAFSLMVEVRNKLVESYQELMRMPV